MSIRFMSTATMSRGLSRVGAVMGRGTNLPGEVALRMYPNVLSEVSFRGTVIVVTGSNGKTTTSNMIAHVMRSAGLTVLNNAKGSNMKPGIAAAVLGAVGRDGSVDSDVVVLEVDECMARFVFDDIKPDYLLVLNLLRDQVTRNGHPGLVFDKLQEAVDKIPDATLVLNANDPISQRLSNGRAPVYFGMERCERSTSTCETGTQDMKVCPRCFHALEYDYYHYNHLGKFRCPNCGFATPAADFVGSDAHLSDGSLLIDGTRVTTGFTAPYNIFNALGAAAVCCASGALTLDQFASGVSDFDVAKTRIDSFEFDDRPVTLLMTKLNATSLDQSISFAIGRPDAEKTAVLYVNNALYTGLKDISWLYDVAFERLRGAVSKVVCLGTRALDAAACLKVAGFPAKDIICDTDVSRTRELLRQTSGSIYVFAASAFGNEGRLVEEMRNGTL